MTTVSVIVGAIISFNLYFIGKSNGYCQGLEDATEKFTEALKAIKGDK